MWSRCLAAALAGLTLSLAFEPVAFAYVLPLALAGFALTTRGLPARRSWLPGLAFGAAFYFTHIWWMNGSIGTGPWLLLSSIEAAFYGALGALAAPLHRLRAWPAWLAVAWLLMETVRSTWPLSGMPWGRLGFAVMDTPVAPALGYLGVSGVGLVLALAGFLLARLVLALRPADRGGEPARVRLAAGGALVAVLAVACLPALAPATLPTTGQVTVAAVQGDVPGPGNNVLFDPARLTRNHAEATLALQQAVEDGEVAAPDFVVWPENSTARDPFLDAGVNADITEAVAAVGVPVLVGGMIDAGPENILNQGIVWDPETGPGERYGKQVPVPYGEWVPFRRFVEPLLTGQAATIARDMLAGDRTTPLRVAGVPVADAICFDIAYDAGLYAQQANGAELLVVQTSNASFIFTDQIEQQFAMTRTRAIESGRYLAVASTNGVSGVIAPDGSVVERTDRLTQDVVVATIDLKQGMTPGPRVGALLALLAAPTTIGGLLLSWWTTRGQYRRRSAPLGRA